MNGSVALHTRILNWLRFPPGASESHHLYQIGCTASTLNVHAQQKRAFNLAWALRQNGFSFADNEVAILGAGISGLTSAAAFLGAGAKKVFIYERTNHLIHLQRGNTTRCLHPNFADWPEDRFRYPVTHLPFMNWRSGAAGHVADQLLWQWKVLEESFKGEKRIEWCMPCSVKGIDIDKDATGPIKVNTNRREFNRSFDLVVVAVGYGIEAHTFSETPSYWRDDEYSQPMIGSGSKRKVLVSGTGDGGLTEVLRLSFDNFQHQSFIQEIMFDRTLLNLGIHLHSELASSANPIDVWQTFLSTPQTPEEVEIIGKFQENYRNDTDVVLNARKPYPSQTDALLLHRLCVALLIKAGKVTYLRGSLDPNVAFDGKRKLFITKLNVGCLWPKKLTFDRVIRRHDAEPDFDNLFKRSRFSSEFIRTIRRNWRTRTNSSEGDVTVQDAHLNGFLADEFMDGHFEKEYEVAFPVTGNSEEEISRTLWQRLPTSFVNGKNFEFPVDMQDNHCRFVRISRVNRFLVYFDNGNAGRVPTEAWGLRSPFIDNAEFLILETNSRELLELMLGDSSNLKYVIFGIHLTDRSKLLEFLPHGMELDRDVVDCGSRVFLVNRREKSRLEIHCDEGMSQAHVLLRAPNILEVFLNKWPTTKVHGIGWAVRNTRDVNETDARGSEILQWDPPVFPLQLKRVEER